uniref:Peptidase S1 domain-containing protein n=1 Tax=Glossina morsitans morsitans TaxID=37546 RepID=A0A1B0FNP9_GLOMM
MAKHFVKIDCEQGGQRRIQFGIIYSENIILTSNEYKGDARFAAPMPLPERPYKQHSKCVVISGDRSDAKTKIVEMKTVVMDRKQCESEYTDLAENVMCIEIPENFCNLEHCDEYFGGSALVCDGVLTALVGANEPCFPLKPPYAPNLHETRIFERSGISDYYEVKGYIEYGAGKIIDWDKARSHTNSTVFTPHELQLSVIMLKEDIPLSPRTAYSMRLPENAPRKDAKCIIATLYPRWMKFSLTLMDYDECVKDLPRLHKDYMCIRQILPRIDDCIQSGNPVICDGELTAIVAKMKNCNKNYPRPVTPIHRYRSWILATMRDLELSGSEQLTFAWLLLLINSIINIFASEKKTEKSLRKDMQTVSAGPFLDDALVVPHQLADPLKLSSVWQLFVPSSRSVPVRDYRHSEAYYNE